MKIQPLHLVTIVAAATFGLAACGGGSGDSATTSSNSTSATGSATASGTSTTSSALAASPGSVSSGTISAFGSVFVNGHEFDIGSAHLVDDDTGLTSTDTSSLEVGMTVDVKAGTASSNTSPSAAELHIHPLARGVVDVSDTTASTLTVLGQSVQLSSATTFSDHRACLTATTSACTAITGQSGLVATTETGASAVAGTFVTVYGYLYSTGSTTGQADIVATLVSVDDAPTATKGVNYKAEGLVTAVGSSSVTIGGLTVNLASASCFAGTGAAKACASAFSVGDIVSAYTSAAPALPVTTLTASVARQRSKVSVQTAGSTIELEGKVSNVTTSPASFVVDGVTVDASAITTALPALGDQVRVLGTVSATGLGVTATTVSVLQSAVTASFGFEGNVDSVVAGTASNTFTLSILGQSIAVDASTVLADRSTRNVRGTVSVSSPASSASAASSTSTTPFNISTFQTHLAASTSQHVQVLARADASGNLSAQSVTILPASTVSAVSGTVDATPAPTNSTATGTPSTFAIHGIAISADPTSIATLTFGHRSGTSATITAGDLVTVRGSYASATLTVAATTSSTPAASNEVIDLGAPRTSDHGCF